MYAERLSSAASGEWIVGVGAVGLAAIMAARNSGVTKIIAADIHDSRLTLAEEFGATHTINSRSTDIVEGVRKITGSTVDFALDCTGVIPRWPIRNPARSSSRSCG